jgi:hypothetical protein
MYLCQEVEGKMATVLKGKTQKSDSRQIIKNFWDYTE